MNEPLSEVIRIGTHWHEIGDILHPGLAGQARRRQPVHQLARRHDGFHETAGVVVGQAVLGADDEDVSELKQRISETRESVLVLEAMISPHASANVKKVGNVVYHLCEDDVYARKESMPNVAVSQQLDDAISALINVYRLETK